MSTISKVLNGHTDVARRRGSGWSACSTSTRTSGAARIARGSTLLELVFSDLSNPWGSEIMAGVQEIAHQEGMSVVLSPSGARHEPGPGWLPGVLQRRPAGVLLVSTDPPAAAGTAQLAQHPVRGDRPGRRAAAGHAVGRIHQLAGGLAATRHLIELGHTRIAALGGHAHMLCSWARLDGYRSAMASAGLPSARTGCTWATSWSTGGRAAAERLRLSLGRPPHGGVRRQRPAGARHHRGGGGARACACPRTCRSSATTTPRSRCGRGPPHHRAPADPADGGGGDAHRPAPRRGASRWSSSASSSPRTSCPGTAPRALRERSSRADRRDLIETSTRGSFR